MWLLIPVPSEGRAGALESAGESGRLWEEEALRPRLFFSGAAESG